MDAEEILGLFRCTQADPSWSFDWLKQSQTGKLTHCYHRYPAKFIPQLVERLLDEYAPGEVHVNDPFFGCGTTIVSAVARGCMASGTEINPVGWLIARVKATPLEPAWLESRVSGFLRRAERSRAEPIVPERYAERLRYWFPEEQMQKLGRLLAEIMQEEPPLRDYLLVAFSHILKSCSLWSQSSTKPLRNPNKRLPEPQRALERHLAKMLRGNEAFWRVAPERLRREPEALLRIEVGDARAQPVESGSVDIVITSSPYVTSYEYADLHQLSNMWLGMVQDMREHRRSFIGSLYAERGKLPPGRIARMIVEQIEERSPRLAASVAAFFADMQEVFRETRRVLRRGGRACYVIGNTRLRGVEVLNAEAFAEGMQIAGLELERVIRRRIPLKILPQKRDPVTGKFARASAGAAEAYPEEFIVVCRRV
ncbi:MAG: site-specific DNA-methyltransferase [Euryarchaeota archaeon]|nr:site-specific DNA-methyltransferase [Euryarchaeota archaeon]